MIVHYQDPEFQKKEFPYHIVCNYGNEKPDNFTTKKKKVTCKRCLMIMKIRKERKKSQKKHRL